MQNFNNKIILILIISVLLVQNIYGVGKRKNFLSHGPSVSGFAQGETVLNNLDDPSIMFYNSSLLSFFDYNNIELSRYNLFEGTAYNVASFNMELLKNLFIGLSAINLSSGDIELRKDAYDRAKIVNTNQWAYILAVSTLIKSIDIGVGANIKYIYMDLYEKKDGGLSFDFSLSKYFKDVDLKYTQATIGLGLSANNIYGTGIKLDTYKEDFQNIFILSSLISIPTKIRFDSKDTLTLCLDLRNEDSYNDFYTGIEYKFINKYALRCGYYLEHITAGVGLNISNFTVNYSMDFNEIDIINRFSLSYRWNRKKILNKEDNLSKEANIAYNEDKQQKRKAKELFKNAQNFYSKKQYLYATEIFKDLIVEYPNYEAPLFYYNKIQKNMKTNSSSKLDVDFDKYTYACGYVNYYNGNYSVSAKEWTKYLQFDNDNVEIKEYYKKIKDILDNSELEERKKEFNTQAASLLNEGINLFNKKQWISCIKTMEKVQSFVKESKYEGSFDYYAQAKEYINKAVKELSKTIKKEVVSKQKNNDIINNNIVEIDEKTSQEKYKEGLILYAKGKYIEAERIWELSLRLNPNNIKAQNALKHIKEDK